MFEGLQRLLTQGYFTQSKTQNETEILFQRTSDSLTAFITEMAIFDKVLVTTRKDAYEAYKKYCDILGLYAVSEQIFTAKMKSTPKLSVTTVSHPSKLRAWRGIGFKTIDDDGKVSKVSEVSLLEAFTPAISEQSQNIERVNGDTSDTSDTANSQKSALGDKIRYCSVECKNFDKPSCEAPNWQSLNKLSEIPLKCPGYSYVGAGEDS
jgi:hypothetical protein